ncbi:uncharacterized protein EAF01_004422 [Botrytis porri]|uniref:Uncharacterized protein n=1 Tax=Botrytis porri TaxID=87229 RepID=A0A4Z1KVI1_9HELO|nr:uncharacterized protein EAF01_004422 [Botrytis porri]KAF7908667.1 hypothetical protein EAF01_004422 [Botrytis porri]TGO88552.1 hypothetical protein BPOR_0155g00060 [Botrytis porri]
MSSNNPTSQNQIPSESGQNPQCTQYQQSQTYQQHSQGYQQSTYQEQPYQQTPYTPSYSTQPQTQQLVYQNPSYQNDQYQQTTYQNTSTTWAPQYNQQQQFQAQYQTVQPAQLTQHSLQSLPVPGRDNVNVYLRDDQNFERVPQGLETRREAGLQKWERGWNAAGRR